MPVEPGQRQRRIFVGMSQRVSSRIVCRFYQKHLQKCQYIVIIRGISRSGGLYADPTADPDYCEWKASQPRVDCLPQEMLREPLLESDQAQIQDVANPLV